MGEKSIDSKLRVLADAAKYDASCASSGSHRRQRGKGLGNSEGSGICHSYTPDGRCVSLLKILLTNYCIYDCLYCINRISSDTPRARFSVEEVVQLTLDFYRRNYIEGLFLSSGIIRNADYTMEQLAEVARRLRIDHQFGGYIHLKAIPGASPELLQRAGRHADRLSANIELATTQDLESLAPAKTLADVDKTMTVVKGKILEARAEKKLAAKKAKPRGKVESFSPSGQSTQFVVGATPTSDAVILHKAQYLYQRHSLKRVYYSAFSPIIHASALLPSLSAPLLREHRLYQADWLLRFYKFKAEELTAKADDNLSLEADPKLAWALRHPEFFPVDINRAPSDTMLRIPGLGRTSVQRIINARRFHSIGIEDLARIRVSIRKVGPFITANEYKPSGSMMRTVFAEPVAGESGIRRSQKQLSLFSETPERALQATLAGEM